MNWMFSTINDISGVSILVPSLLAFWKWNRILPEYYPFTICILIAFLNEALGLIITKINIGSVNISGNIYVLAEGMLLTWQFQRWRLFKAKTWIFPTLMGILATAWIMETLAPGHSGKVSSYYRIVYSFILVLCSMVYLNRLLLSPYAALYCHPGFVLALAFIFYFLYKILIEVFWMYGLTSSNSFLWNVYVILDVINILTNLIFAYTFLWMDKKQPFTMPF